jgi:hypothetical protein
VPERKATGDGRKSRPFVHRQKGSPPAKNSGLRRMQHENIFKHRHHSPFSVHGRNAVYDCGDGEILAGENPTPPGQKMIAKLIYAYLIGITTGFVLGARYVYDYHTELRDKL